MPENETPQTNSFVESFLRLAEYSFQVLGAESFNRWANIYELLSPARGCSEDEIRFIISEVWTRKPVRYKVPEENFIAGSEWEGTRLIERAAGNTWRARCSCGEIFVMSTADDQPRKCPACRLIKDIEFSTTQACAHLREISGRIEEWVKDYDKWVYRLCHRALRLRGNDYGEVDVEELHSLCWQKIASIADKFDPKQKVKPITWIGTVVTNLLIDHFWVLDNRQRLAPTTSYAPDADIWKALPDPKDGPPQAKPVRPHNTETAAGEAYDRALGAAWSQ